MTKVDFRRKKYLTIRFSQLLNNFSCLVLSYLYVNSDDIIFACSALEKQLYILIDNSREFLVFSSHTSKCFQNCRIPKHQRSDCTSKMPAKKHSERAHFYKAFNFFSKKDGCSEMLSITFLGKENKIQEDGSGKQHSPAPSLYRLTCVCLGLSVICAL